MNTYAKLAIAAAAVLVVAVVGINLLPGTSPVVGGPAVSLSPSPQASPSPSPSPQPRIRLEPSPVADAFPPAGQLSIGRHRFSQNGIPFSLEVSTPGWLSDGSQVAPDGGSLTKGDATPQKVWMILWSIDGVYADPCGHVAAPPVSPSATDLAAAVAAMPGLDIVTGPIDVTLGGKSAKHVAIKVREDIACSPEQFYMWYDDVRCGQSDPCQRWATALRETNRIWIVEVDGKHIWIEAETLDSASPETVAGIQQMIDSIQFE